MDAGSDQRVLVLMPTARDGERTVRMLAAAGLPCVVCGCLADLCRQMNRGAGVALLAEETLDADRGGELAAALRGQPPWSDFPLVVVAREGAETRRSSLREAMNATLVERPVRVRSLLSVVRAALRSRRHQYAVRDHLAEREKAEEALRFALQAGRLGAWEVDLATRQMTCSDLCKQNFGRPPDRPFSYEDLLAAVHPDDRERMRAAVERAVAAVGDYDIEYRVLWPDGSVHWVLVRGRVAAGPDGVPTRIAGVSMDVTERKAAEEQLRDAAEKKDEFIALLGHELRNPLAPIRNGLQVLELAGANPEAVAATRAMMARQLSHMVRLIDDLLDVSRINRHKMELRRAVVPLSEVLRSALEAARPAVDAAGHELTVETPPDDIYLDADLTRLAQVFSNLLTNSAKYTPPGGRIWLTAEPAGDRVAVSVRDSGIGIPAAALPTIFDMFSQVDRSVERATGGLGIGLALVRGLTEMHGGTVAVASGGPGTTFTVTLPTVVAPAATPIQVDGPPTAVAARRVLVVDDNRDGAESLTLMLQLLGHEVRAAHDGLEAVEQSAAFAPDLILMDVGMPRLNGLDATRRIREQPRGRGITIIALTGWGQEHDRERSRSAGCDGHLVKPVGLSDLQQLLATGR